MGLGPWHGPWARAHGNGFWKEYLKVHETARESTKILENRSGLMREGSGSAKNALKKIKPKFEHTKKCAVVAPVSGNIVFQTLIGFKSRLME